MRALTFFGGLAGCTASHAAAMRQGMNPILKAMQTHRGDLRVGCPPGREASRRMHECMHALRGRIAGRARVHACLVRTD